ncbi:MAG: hypothetical protein IT379_38775 [Deltaproteobacteria bacterium]|nr:hypothetical protein [Deltaproteobacteria bacterium]
MILATSSCGDDDGPLPTFDAALEASDDAGPIDAQDAGTLFAPPEIPWLAEGAPPIEAPVIPWLDVGAPEIAPPSFGACPEGWDAVDDEDVVGRCDPGAAVELDTCAAADEGRLPGADTCTRVGTPCPDGPWAADPPGGGVLVFVLAGAGPGGDGSREMPFGTIREALAATPAGGTVMIAKGRYEETVSLVAGRTLRGACTAETVLTSSSPSGDTGVLSARGLRDVTTVTDLRIADAARVGISVSGEHATVVLARLVIERPTGLGIFVSDGRLEATDVVVRDVASAADGNYGHALGVIGGEAAVTRASFERARGVAVLGVAARSLVLSDVSVLDTEGFGDGTYGIGVSIEDGNTVELSRVVIARARHTGLYVGGATATLAAEHVVVRDTRPQQRDLAGGTGFAVRLGATASVRAMVIERSRESGVLVANGGASLELRDAVVRETRSREDDGKVGRGIGVELGGRLVLERAVVARNREAGIVVKRPESDSPSSAVIADVVVRDTEVEEETQALGQGLQVGELGTVQLHRALLEGNHETGLLVAQAATLTIEDLVVRDTRERPDGRGGRGMSIEQGGVVEGERVLIEGCRDAALSAIDPGTRLTLADVVVRDTDVELSTGHGGRGISAQRASETVVTRGLLERNRSEGVLAAHSGTHVGLLDVEVRLTRARPIDRQLGHGIQVQSGARVDAERALIADSRAFGVVVYGAESSLSARDVAVVDTRASEADGLLGHGVQVEEHASAELDRVLVRGSRERGVVGWLSTVALRDVVIDDTRSSAMGRLVSGVGLSATEQATVRATRFSIGNAALCGVQVTSGSALDLEDGEIYGAEVGACVQIEGYDLARLSTRVLYRDNGVNLDSTTHPDPEAVSLELE